MKNMVYKTIMYSKYIYSKKQNIINLPLKVLA